MRKLEDTFDVVVCGGGLAGVCAAIAASRNGSRTCIVQDRPVFGGNSSSEIRVFPQGAANFNAYARETGIISELLIEERAVNHEPNQDNGRTNSVWDMLLYDKIVSSPNLSFYLNTTVHAVQKSFEGKIEAIHARINNAETELVLHAEIFIDCSGDGILAALSSCEWRMGTEGQDEFGEPHAPTQANSDVMGSSIHFRAKDIGRPVLYQAPSWVYEYNDPDVFYKGGRIPHDPEGGYWWIELGIPWNTIVDNETIRHELTRHVLGIWDFIKNKDPDLMSKASNYALDWIGQVPGKRESRRILGHYLLTELDIVNHTLFEDEIAFGGWYIDLHQSGGLLAEYSEQAAAEGHHSEYMNKSYITPYGIPLRCLIAKGVPNLMMAGRQISATHVALGSSRIQGTTALLGQAAGTAAALALRKGENLTAIASNTISEIKQQLLKDDCFLLHTTNEDPLDLARKASLLASSEATTSRVEPFFKESPNLEVDEEPLTEMRGQWIAISTAEVTTISVCLSNLSAAVQWVEASIVPVNHIWDYRVNITPQLAHTKLAVSPGRNQWVHWDLNLLLESNLTSHYVRLAIGANDQIIWHKSVEFIPGMMSAYDMGNGLMRRYGNGETLSFAIEPEQSSFPVHHVISGVTRPYQHTNLWRSNPTQALPQWIELSWNDVQTISQIQLTFAGNLLRDYRFYPPFNQDPQCVKTYEICAWIDGDWVQLKWIYDNYQRQRIHTFNQAVHTDKIRIVVYETHGDLSAAIYEVRVY